MLAERLGVTERTVRRDINRLRELGYAIVAVKGPDGGYRLTAGSELPPLLFDDEQALAIAGALQSASSTGIDLEDAASRALLTVRQVLPSHLRHRMDRVQFADTHAGHVTDVTVLETVSAAVRDRCTLRFDYGAESAGPPRHVEPHAIVKRKGPWYLIAWNTHSAAWAIYRLDKMSPKAPGGTPFAPRQLPTVNARSFLAARMKGSDGADAWPCFGEFLLPLPMAEIEPWIDDGEMEYVSDDCTRVRVGSWSWAGLLAWALRFDVPFTVVGPAPFIDAVPRFAARIVAAAPQPPPEIDHNASASQP
ncbi:helix-turn-helix transcriptional regulator [Paramicrobacterium sp. CJ85]|uniref:helix-turn-helix transcriptional regulator n=1 Tax=Paramicrobacterium sp. CJ85 TaxID=3445355 RepID=UPI003F6429B7